MFDHSREARIVVRIPVFVFLSDPRRQLVCMPWEARIPEDSSCLRVEMIEHVDVGRIFVAEERRDLVYALGVSEGARRAMVDIDGESQPDAVIGRATRGRHRGARHNVAAKNDEWVKWGKGKRGGVASGRMAL